jgi:uncharacterized membrane protein YeiH
MFNTVKGQNPQNIVPFRNAQREQKSAPADGGGITIPPGMQEGPGGSFLSGLIACAVFFFSALAMSSTAAPSEPKVGGMFVSLLISLYPAAGSLATLLFAVSGARAANSYLRKHGAIGFVALTQIALSGILTGIGGGLFLRDPILWREPSALVDPALIAWTLVGIVIAVALKSEQPLIDDVIDALDYIAVGMTATFAYDLATTYSSNAGSGLVNAATVFIAIVSAAGGGMVRDKLVLFRTAYAFSSPYLSTIFLVTLVHIGLQPLRLALQLPDAHDIWAMTVVVAVITGSASRKFSPKPLRPAEVV